MGSELVFYSVNKNMITFQGMHADCVSTVAEPKYVKENDEQLSNLTNLFPFRLSKNSK